MLPQRSEAEALLKEAEGWNPGPWGDHSRVAARCAQRIAANCPGMDAEKAYIVALLHDIGRKFGVKHMGHVYDGYVYMKSLGYDEAARICLSHSFNTGKVEDYIGKVDVTAEELATVRQALQEMEFDEYDLLVQLCDSMAGAEGVMSMEARMSDIKRRYGAYPQEKWDRNFALRAYFEQRSGKDLYEMVQSLPGQA